MSGKSQTIGHFTVYRLSQILPRSSGMDGDKSEESGAFLFSRRVPDFCDGRRSFPTNEKFAHYQSPKLLGSSPPITQVSIFDHFPFPAKFIGRIRERIVAIIRYIWDGRQEVKAPFVWDFPDI